MVKSFAALLNSWASGSSTYTTETYPRWEKNETNFQYRTQSWASERNLKHCRRRNFTIVAPYFLIHIVQRFRCYSIYHWHIQLFMQLLLFVILSLGSFNCKLYWFTSAFTEFYYEKTRVRLRSWIWQTYDDLLSGTVFCTVLISFSISFMAYIVDKNRRLCRESVCMGMGLRIDEDVIIPIKKSKHRDKLYHQEVR